MARAAAADRHERTLEGVGHQSPCWVGTAGGASGWCRSADRSALASGMISGVPVSGSSMIRQASPKTSSTSSAVTISDGSPVGDDPSGLHRDQVGGVPAGMVEVVQHRDQGPVLLDVQIGAQVEHLDLVGDVEVGGRLVQQQDRRLLGQRHRQPHPLPLAAGQLVDRPVGQVGHLGRGQRLGDDLLVGAAPLSQQPLMRVPAAGHQIGDGDPVRRDRRLRQQPEPAGHLLGRVGGDGPAVQQDRPGGRGQHPGQRPQQGGLAARVGADDDGELVVRDVHRQPGGDHPGVVADRDTVGPESIGLLPIGCGPP